MKVIRLRLLLTVLMAFLSTVLAAQTDTVYYFINEIYPDNIRIRVGDRMCKVLDTIPDYDTVFVEEDQIIEVFAIFPPSAVDGIPKTISKHKFQVLTDSPYSDIRGMYSKGKEDIFVIIEGDSIVIDHDMDPIYQYRLRVNEGEKIVLPSSTGKLVLQWELLQNYSGLINVYIDREKSRFDIEKVEEFKIDIIRNQAKH